MGKYVYVYRGGAGMPESEAEQKAAMDAWQAWYGELGDAIVDGGNPFGASATVKPDGTTASGGASSLGGYSIVSADSLEAASKMAGGCPVLKIGASVEIYETIDMTDMM